MAERAVTVAAIQMQVSESRSTNISEAERLVRLATSKGAQIICLPELFQGWYFCQTHDAKHYDEARELEKDEAIQKFKEVAKELKVVLPISFYERKSNALYNSVAVIDADGTVLGTYRKTHIPDGPGYSEKFYFSPGDTGFKVWQTKYAKIGIGICWDQWFPECSRSMALLGAELLIYPTAIGSEPHDPTIDSKDHWQICMQGQSAANLVPLIACNRIGQEHVYEKHLVHEQQKAISTITFYGSSFITSHQGLKIKEATKNEEDILVTTFNLDSVAKTRLAWGIFRDRQPQYYSALLTKDGSTPFPPKN